MVMPTLGELMDGDILDNLQDKDTFRRSVEDSFKEVCKDAHFKPRFSHALMHDAWESFCWDTERLKDNMPEESKPDHYKICGFATYWLRRNSPVIALHKDNTVIKNDAVVMGLQDLLSAYGRSFLAFNFGYKICHYCEINRATRKDSDGLLKPDMDYIETLCYVMKYKNLSPHAMGMIYRSLFFGNGGG